MPRLSTRSSPPCDAEVTVEKETTENHPQKHSFCVRVCVFLLFDMLVHADVGFMGTCRGTGEVRADATCRHLLIKK